MQGAWWQLTIRLEVEEYELLRALAAIAGKDLSEFVHDILSDFMKTKKDIATAPRSK